MSPPSMNLFETTVQRVSVSPHWALKKTRGAKSDALDDKVDELVLVHVFDVAVGDEERNVVALDGDPSQDDERLGAHHEEPGELVREDALNLVGLLDLDREADRVDRRLDEDLLRGVRAMTSGVRRTSGVDL